MILTGPDTARALEAAEAAHLRRQVEAWHALGGAGAHVVEIGGGVAAFTETLFGRKLNHVTGFGLGGPVEAGELAALEAAYAARGLDVQIDLCPHVAPATLALLATRGYALDAYSNTYVRTLGEADERGATGDVEILSGAAEMAALFEHACVAGFSLQAQPRPPELLQALARIAMARDDTTLFVARLGGEIAGSAGMSVIETPIGRLAQCYIASTLPAWRGRGVQATLLRARLAAARRAGCTLACVMARPANTSARNAERAGFCLAYTKSTVVRRRVAA